MNECSESPLLIDIRDACRLISIGKTKLYELVRDPNNQLPIIKIGNRTLLHRADVEHFIEQLRTRAHGQSAAATPSPGQKFPQPARATRSTEPSTPNNNRANTGKSNASTRLERLPRSTANGDGHSRSSAAPRRRLVKKGRTRPSD
jgi:excisionase family DNA binding protein